MSVNRESKSFHCCYLQDLLDQLTPQRSALKQSRAMHKTMAQFCASIDQLEKLGVSTLPSTKLPTLRTLGFSVEKADRTHDKPVIQYFYYHENRGRRIVVLAAMPTKVKVASDGTVNVSLLYGASVWLAPRQKTGMKGFRFNKGFARDTAADRLLKAPVILTIPDELKPKLGTIIHQSSDWKQFLRNAVYQFGVRGDRLPKPLWKALTHVFPTTRESKGELDEYYELVDAHYKKKKKSVQPTIQEPSESKTQATVDFLRRPRPCKSPVRNPQGLLSSS